MNRIISFVLIVFCFLSSIIAGCIDEKLLDVEKLPDVNTTITDVYYNEGWYINITFENNEDKDFEHLNYPHIITDKGKEAQCKIITQYSLPLLPSESVVNITLTPVENKSIGREEKPKIFRFGYETGPGGINSPFIDIEIPAHFFE